MTCSLRSRHVPNNCWPWASTASREYHTTDRGTTKAATQSWSPCLPTHPSSSTDIIWHQCGRAARKHSSLSNRSEFLWVTSCSWDHTQVCGTTDSTAGWCHGGACWCTGGLSGVYGMCVGCMCTYTCVWVNDCRLNMVEWAGFSGGLASEWPRRQLFKFVRVKVRMVMSQDQHLGVSLHSNQWLSVLSRANAVCYWTLCLALCLMWWPLLCVDLLRCWLEDCIQWWRGAPAASVWPGQGVSRWPAREGLGSAGWPGHHCRPPARVTEAAGEDKGGAWGSVCSWVWDTYIQ